MMQYFYSAVHVHVMDFKVAKMEILKSKYLNLT